MLLNIEITSFCNQNCYFCPQNKYRMKNKIMSMKLFKSIIDSLHDMKIPVSMLVFSGMGEPLTDTKLFEKIEYARKICDNTIIYTNGALFTKEKLALASKLLRKVFLSIHGNTPEEYEKYSGNKFSRIKEIAILAKKSLGTRLIILNYPSGKLGKYLGIGTGPTHPIHNWGDKEIAKKTGSDMAGCRFCYLLGQSEWHIKVRVDGSLSTCGNDWNAKNNLLNKEFPVCKVCYNYEHFKKVIADKRFTEYIQLLKILQEKIGGRSG